ncbi:hypothetical protein DH86_00000657 [Scytalidium sp. 3C]|nr:hypothetical protein DH86_00000657 [Scytalidium sp. 3C]
MTVGMQVEMVMVLKRGAGEEAAGAEGAAEVGTPAAEVTGAAEEGAAEVGTPAAELLA